MLLQNTLDLSTFEIVRFRIWNQTSQPSDRGFGSKYFNTNSGHEAYCREEIFTPIGWRTAAYLDDIDKVNEKLDLIFGEELDTDTIIDSWKEVQDFLSGIEDTKTLMTMLDGKLDKKGGTMTGGLTVPHLDVASASGNAWIRFKSGGEEWGYIGFAAKGRPKLHDGEGWYDLLYTGNVGEYTAGAAKKLETAVSLWGNKFDGTQSLDGSISFKDGDKLRSVLDYVNNSEFHLGYGTRTLNLTIWGTPIYFYANSTRAMAIDDAGNVVIGNGTNKLGADLCATGLVHLFGGISSNPTLGDVPQYGVVTGYNEYGISQWVLGNGQGNIQVGRFDGTATAYALNLNPLGGAVNVGGNLAPNANNSLSLGTSSYRWSNVYSVGGDFSGRVLIGGVEDDGTSLLQIGDESVSPLRVSSTGSLVYRINLTGGWARGIYFRNKDKNLLASISAFGNGENLSYLYIGTDAFSTSKRWFDINSTESNFNVLTKFNGGALIPTGQTLTIGSVTFRETAAGEVEVDGNLHATGTLASGGKGEAGENTTGNAMVYQYDLASGESVYTVNNVKGSTNVIVQIFEWNINTSSWDMILTDVSVKADAITVTFGRTTTVNHMVTVC